MQAHWIDDAAWASPWRHRQVGEKVALSLGLVLSALVLPPWPTTLAVTVVSVVAVIAFARIPARVLGYALAAPAAFIVVSALSVVVGVGAPSGTDEWWRLGPFSLGPSRAVQAAELVAHAVAGTLALMVLATTTPMVDLLTWSRRLHLPEPLVEVASLTYRLLWVLLATTLTIREAQAARLGDAPIGPGALGRRLESAGLAAGQVLARSWSRARRLEDGLAGRGYEASLATLAPSPAACWPLRLGTVGALAGVWVLAWVVR